ncbi:hypothetical protein ABKA04_000332 [Annulohypoxylon sp. FPYF3050]
MDSATCNVIYVDRNVLEDRTLGSSGTEIPETGELRNNLGLLLDAFGNELKPTLVLIDTPYDEQALELPLYERDHSPCSEVSRGELTESDLSPPANDGTNDGANDESSRSGYVGYLSEAPSATSKSLSSRALLRRCLDAGAVDVMASPMHIKTLTTLEVHAYRAHKKAAREQQAALEVSRGRKRSWVGVHEDQPYSYLREAMVSGLMKGICRLSTESDDRIGSVKVSVPSEHRSEIAEAVGRWHFCAHDFGDDALLIAAILMFKHAFTMPELEHWRIPTDQLTTYLVATRAAYNTFVPYHNFRHAVDVLQATFNFLVQIGALPPYPSRSGSATPTEKSPLAYLIRPFEALTLLIGAIGHDVGHPGVNNGFLVVLNAPLAQLYNDRSVLESFHCAAYSQILRRYWPRVFEDTKMRTLMVSSILATDMGLHFDYMRKLGDLQGKLKEIDSIDCWNGRMIEEQTAFLCSLLIKCADISNVAREHEAALQWMYILCDEFSRQSTMENDIGIPSSLIAPPKKDFLSLAQAQLGFMNMFAIPLFQGIADVLPAMQYTVDELERNKSLFEKTVEEIPGMGDERKKRLAEGILSPRSASLANQPEKTGLPKDSEVCDLIPNHADIKKAGSSPPGQPYHIPSIPGNYKEMNGVSTGFDSIADFAASDPFNINDSENKLIGHNGKQRCSETTDGSSSVPTGDWQSQATSATTGKMPLSPSTQGTSIVSQESMERERPCNLPVTTVTAPDSRMIAPMMGFESGNSEEDSNGNTLKPEPERGLKKKGSRFRMNVSTFFRRNKGASSPSSGGS